MKRYVFNFSCGNAVPTQFLMWERRSHAFPPHYTTALTHMVCRKESIYNIVIYLGYIMDIYGYYVISCMTIAGTQWSCRGAGGCRPPCKISMRGSLEI